MSEFSNEEDEERHLVKHMGCMASLFHFFDRPYAPSAPHRRHKFSSSHSQIGAESVSPSERSEQSGPLVLPEKETVTASPEPTRASLSSSAFKATTTWKLREAPRLSLDSRLRPPPPPREIRTSVGNSGHDSGDDRRSPSVVARLMGVDTLPTGSGPGSPAQLCRSASESRVPREASYYRFIDPSGFNNAMDYNYNYNNNSYNNNSYGFNGKRVVVVPEPKPDLCVRVSNPNPNPNLNPIQINPHVPFHRRSSFEPVDCYPDPKRSNGGGEITLYGEIERRLRKRGIDEPCKDLETLKQILEALQLKGLLHSQPVDKQSDGRRSFSDDHQQPPPIVLMKPSSRPPRSPRNERPLINRGGRPGVHPKREIDRMVHTTVRSRSPDRGEIVRGPGSPPVSPNRRRPGCNAASPKRTGGGQLGGNVESPRSPQIVSKQKGISAIRCGKVRPEPLAVRSEKSRRDVRPVEDDTSPSVSSSSISTSSGIDFERSKLVEEESNGNSGRHLLERCDKLLSSIAAFTSTDIGDSQPSPVSVLDASFLTDESSPSLSSKRLAMPPKSPTGNNIWRTESDSDRLFDSDSDEHEPCTVIGSESDDQDCLYLREFLRVSYRCSDLCKVSELLKKRHLSSSSSSSSDDDATLLQRSLIYDSVREIIENVRQVSPWDAFTGRAGVSPHALKQHVWGELQKIREPTVNFSELVDLNEATRRAIEKDFSADHRWSKQSVEISDAVLQIERLVFKDLVADTIKELADAGYTDHYMVPRRKLVF